MIDPVRPEVVDAIRECRGAGIRPVMITGDHKDTAVAIAKELGILEAGWKAVTGAEIDQLSDEELDRRIEEYAVYARVQPEHKVRIVDAWKRKRQNHRDDRETESTMRRRSSVRTSASAWASPART